MVNNDTLRGDRAQLILVGCVAIAFIVIGVTLVINTNLYTQSAAPALTNEQVEDSRAFDLETRKGARSLIHRVNHNERDRDSSELQNDVAQGMQSYDSLLAESYARSEPARVSVTYNDSSSQYGKRVVQADDGELDDDGESNLLRSSQTVGWFAINVDVLNTSEGDTGSFELTVESDSTPPSTLTMQVYRNDSANLTVLADMTGASERSVTCDPIRDRVLIDVYEGQIVADQCSPNGSVHGIDDLDGQVQSIGFDNEGEIAGRYEFVSDGDTELPSCATSISADEACETPAVWTANVSTTYQGDGIDYSNDRDIEIYTTGS